MINPSISVVQPDILIENMITIQSFLRQSYAQVTAHLQEGVSFLKGEFRQMYEQGKTSFTNLVSPVNNYLKNHKEIENEFQRGYTAGTGSIATRNIIPLDIALQSNNPMEENY